MSSNRNVTKTTYPDGYFVDRVYDELNRMTDIKLNGAGTSAVQFQYDALSRRTKLVYENGCTTNYAFEVDNDLSSLLHNFVGSNVQFNYSFDNANQMATHRVSDPANFRWSPPAPATTTYGTASNINQYPTVGGVAQTYSTDGNLTNDGTFKYEFNTERMMTRVRNAGTNAIIADYLYDPALRQRQKNVGGVKTNYYYSGFQRLADYDGSAGTPGTLLNRYVYGSGMDEILIQITAGGTKTYYHSNHQGSVIATTNSAGAVLNRYTYGPFGESAALTGTTHGYTGQRYDSETGNYYFKMRYYSPKLGRFLQPDPIGMAGGINLYGYVGNSPLSVTDVMGLAPAAVSAFDPYRTARHLGAVSTPQLDATNMSRIVVKHEVFIELGGRPAKVDILGMERSFRNYNYNSVVTTLEAVYIAEVRLYHVDSMPTQPSMSVNKFTGGYFSFGQDAAGNAIVRPVYFTTINVPWETPPPPPKVADAGLPYSVLQGSSQGLNYWNDYDGAGNLLRSYTLATFSGFHVAGTDSYISYLPGAGNGASGNGDSGNGDSGGSK